MNSFWHSDRLLGKAIKTLTLTQRIASGYVVTIIFFLAIALLTYLINTNTVSMLTRFSQYSNKALDASSFSADINRLKQASDRYIHEGFGSAAQEVQRIYDSLLGKLALEENKQDALTYGTVLVIREHLNHYIDAFRKAQEQKKLQNSLIHTEIPRIVSRIEKEINRQNSDGESIHPSPLEIRDLLLTIENNMHRYFNTYDADYLKNIQTRFSQMHTLSPRGQKSALSKELNTFEHTVSAVLQRTRGYLYLTNVVMSAEAYEMLYQSEHIASVLKTRMMQTEKHIVSNIEWHKFSITVSAVLFLLLLLAIAYIMGASITRPIKILTQTFKEMARGSQKEVDIVYAQHDEISELIDAARSFRFKNIENESLLAQYKTLNETLEEQVEQRTEELKEKNRTLNELAITDNLTSLYNRNKLNEVIESEIARGNRYEHHFSIILLDIDHFKQVNDTHGHQTGDAVLRQISRLLKETCRKCDTVGRWGGEEFMILCVNTGKTEAAALAEKLRKTIEEFRFEKIGNMTSSFGVSATYKNITKEDLISEADRALYKAKSSGRNKVGIYDQIISR